MISRMLRVIAFSFAVAMAAPALSAPPPGFVVEKLGGSFSGVVGAEFLPDGALLAWEYGGKVWRVEADGSRQSQPVLDLSDEVGRWGDHGLLGLALHPNFAESGLVYLLYAVDREHFLRGGTPNYNAANSIPEQASISRLASYRITRESGWRTADPNSRKVLLGRDASDGFPLVNRCHGEGSLIFGEDGTLLVGFGDSASPWYVDRGLEGPTNDGYTTQAIADGTLRSKSHVGAFRAQLIDDLSGKILRLDPDTGLGVPSNPYFDATAPNAPRSKVWALGLRNPYRMTRLPGTGAHDPSAANPGTLVVGDVGWDDREELDLITTGGMNLGWPLYEGITPMTYVANSPASSIFHGLRTINQDAAPGDSNGGIPFVDLLAPSNASHWVDGRVLVQIEDGTITSGIYARSHGGYSGRGYVDFIADAGESAQVIVTAPTVGTTAIAIRYALGAETSRTMRLLIDGSPVAQPSFGTTSRWDLWQWLVINIPLSAGAHSICLESIGQSGPNIDGVVAYTGSNPAILGSTQTPKFRHTPPILDMPQPPTSAVAARVPSASGPVAWRTVDDPAFPRICDPFTSECIVAGPQVDAADWPNEWRHRIYIGDYTAKWIRAVELGPDLRVRSVTPFDLAAGVVMWLGVSPIDGQLYAARFSELVRIRYQPTGNRPPNVMAKTSIPYGSVPLTVQFDGSASKDPEGGALSFLWDFGDGTYASTPIATHSFGAAGQGPSRAEVKLTVRDAAGAEVSSMIPIWPGNKPPEITLESPRDGQRYDAANPAGLEVDPLVFDPDGQQVSCQWQLSLLHDSHSHPWGGPSACTSMIEIEPTPCAGSTYAYELTLTATDPLGLSSSVTRRLLPRCLPCRADLDGSDEVDFGDLALIMLEFGATGQSVADLDGSAVVDFGDAAIAMLSFGPCG